MGFSQPVVEPRESQSDEDPANDWREVFNYRRALHAGVSSALPLSLRLIRDLHRELLTGVRGRDRSPGDFRRAQVYLGVSKRFIPPPPFRLTECLDAFEKYLHRNDTGFDPLVDCFLVHYQFEAIHPFVDGNGRVGRLLLALMVQQRTGLTKPWLYMSAYFEHNREEYIDRLFNISARGDWSAWIEFCLHGAIAQTEDAIRRCDKLLRIKSDFVSRVEAAGGSVRLHQIVELMFNSPFVRVGDLARSLNVTYPTAKADIDRLVQAGILRELATVTPKTYYAPEVFDIAYDDLEHK